MVAFPAAGYLSADGRLNEDAVTALEAFLAAAKQLPGGAPITTYVLSGGNVTPDRALFLVDTEGAAATDDLERIVPTGLPDGAQIVIGTVDSSRKVTVRHAAGGTGQIVLDDSADLQLGSRTMALWLYLEGSQWREIHRNHGTQQSAGRAWLGLGDLATRTFASLQPAASQDYTVASGSQHEFEHGLGATPLRFWGVLRCVTADAGYDVGDTVMVDGSFFSSSPRMLTLYANDTICGAIASNAGNPLAVVNAGTGAVQSLTLANWRLKLYASLL